MRPPKPQRARNHARQLRACDDITAHPHAGDRPPIRSGRRCPSDQSVFGDWLPQERHRPAYRPAAVAGGVATGTIAHPRMSLLAWRFGSAQRRQKVWPPHDMRCGEQTMQSVQLVNERRGTYPHPQCINLWTVRGQLRRRRPGASRALRCQRIEQIGPDQDCASPRPGCRISVMRPAQIRSDTPARGPRVPESRSFAMLSTTTPSMPSVRSGTQALSS
jgi:hypothetical protein